MVDSQLKHLSLEPGLGELNQELPNESDDSVIPVNLGGRDNDKESGNNDDVSNDEDLDDTDDLDTGVDLFDITVSGDYSQPDEEIAFNSVDEVFNALAEKMPNYEPRQQQLDLANDIDRAFKKGKVGIFEAGTGTGKSLAALVPAILSGKRVVISTATISLQEQYVGKDIPTLESILLQPLKVALVKGRGNYLSQRRLDDHLKEHAVDERLLAWSRDTEYGDVSELDFIPASETWSEVNSDSDDCLRNKCPNFSKCFYFENRNSAQKAKILVVNHALLLADAVSDGAILPTYDLLIVDEAHHMPTIATDAFSAGISIRGIKSLLGKATKRVQAPLHLIHGLEYESTQFFDKINMQYRTAKARVKKPLDGIPQLRDALYALQEWISSQTFEHILDVDMAREKTKLKAKALNTTIGNYINCLNILEEPGRDWVVFVERPDPKRMQIQVVASPLDVSQMLQQYLFDKSGLHSSVWMSATLATGGDDPFSYFKQLVGAPRNVIQTQVPSPFDYGKQALLYLPKGLPEPNSKEYSVAAARQIERLINLSQGRAFALFTSYSAMNQCYELLRNVIPYPIQKQGEMPRKKLIEWFLETPQAVLMGTSSFWEGVSIDGDQLSLVVIDRIPFQAPDDPVYEARCEQLQESGEGSWFADLALPHATMRLKQGVGRLIRTKFDRGIVAVLDPRLTGKHYGRRIIGCLPPMTITNRLNDFKTLDDALEHFTKRQSYENSH